MAVIDLLQWGWLGLGQGLRHRDARAHRRATCICQDDLLLFWSPGRASSASALELFFSPVSLEWVVFFAFVWLVCPAMLSSSLVVWVFV